jgi:F-type H+-transporting ATPase subunit b
MYAQILTAPLQSLDVISVNLWNILFSLFNLVLVFLIVKRFLFKPVKKMLAARQKTVDDAYGKADEALAAAEADKALYEQRLALADEEADQIIRSAGERARKAEESIIADANRKAANLLRQADEDIAYERKRAVNEIKDQISDISVDIAEKMLEREIKEEDHRDLIDRFISDIGSSERRA